MTDTAGSKKSRALVVFGAISFVLAILIGIVLLEAKFVA